MQVGRSTSCNAVHPTAFLRTTTFVRVQPRRKRDIRILLVYDPVTFDKDDDSSRLEIPLGGLHHLIVIGGLRENVRWGIESGMNVANVIQRTHRTSHAANEDDIEIVVEARYVLIEITHFESAVLWNILIWNGDGRFVYADNFCQRERAPHLNSPDTR